MMKKTFQKYTSILLILFIIFSTFNYTIYTQASSGTPRSAMRISMRTSVDGQDVLNGYEEINVTVEWLESLSITEPVTISVTKEAKILVDTISDIEFTTNGIKKDISDLEIQDNTIKFMTGIAVKQSLCTLKYKVRTPLAAGDFKISTKVAAENAVSTPSNFIERTFTVTSGLTVDTTYNTIYGDTPFHVFGEVNYRTQLPDPVISLDVYHAETEEVVYQLTGTAYPTDNSYDIGSLVFPDTCEDGEYIVHVTLADGWNIIGTATKKINYVKSKEFKITVWDIVRKTGNNDPTADLKFSREYVYELGQQITEIQPTTYENAKLSVTITPETGSNFVVDDLYNITGIMPSSNVEITYLHEVDQDILQEIVSINVIKDESLRLSDEMQPFNFIWVAKSSHNTVVKINTDTNAVVAEYRTAPVGQPGNPSRTTVDKDGSLWVANRDGNSVTKIGLIENGQYRNGTTGQNTSTGLGDVKDWTNAGGADTNGGASTAADDSIIHYVRTSSTGTRHVSVDKDNNVWVSGTGNRIFDLINTTTGSIIKSEGSVGYGGYGGLIDDNGVIWSSNPILRWDTSKPLSGPQGTNWNTYNYSVSYGLGIDSQGNVWNSTHNGDGKIRKLSPDGAIIGAYNQGSVLAQGVVVGLDDDVWVAHSYYNSTIARLKNDGTFVGNLVVSTNGSGATGVAVDNKGYIWATLYNGNVIKIDPNDGPIGSDGVTPIGRIVKTIAVGGTLYNYSDMTGSTLLGAPDNGTYEFMFDSQKDNIKWSKIEWKPEDLEENTNEIYVSSSTDNITFSDFVAVTNKEELNIPDGRYIRVKVHLHRGASGNSPIIDSIVVTGITQSEL